MNRRRLRHRARLVTLTAAVLLPLAACSDDSPEEGEGRLRLDDAVARIVRQDGDEERVEDEDVEIRTGDQVTLVEGSGRLELEGDTTFELRAAGDDDRGSTVVMGPRPVLEAGDLLVITDQPVDLTIAETVVIVAGGAARLSSNVAVEVASYTAEARVDSAGQERSIPPLREMQIPALGLPPDRARPFEYDPTDPWDRRFLGEAIDLGERLEALAGGYTQNLAPGSGRTVGFFHDVLPGLADEPELTADLLQGRSDPGETLVGAAIADLGRRGTFTERWHAIFAFRDEGASWGLVALDQGVDRGPLLDAVTAAVERTPLAIAPIPSGRGGGPGGSSGGDGGATVTPTTSTTNPPTTRPTSPTTTVPPPPPVEEKSDGLLPPLLGPIIDPVTDLLSGLVDGLLGGLL